MGVSIRKPFLSATQYSPGAWGYISTSVPHCRCLQNRLQFLFTLFTEKFENSPHDNTCPGRPSSQPWDYPQESRMTAIEELQLYGDVLITKRTVKDIRRRRRRRRLPLLSKL